MDNLYGFDPLSLSHREMDQLEAMSDYPRAKVNDVTYVLAYGEGFIMERIGGRLVACPVWVWRAERCLDYTAPKHVSDALDDALNLAEEVRQAERAAGWPSP